MPMRFPSGSLARNGESEAEYRSMRRLIVQAASAATSQPPPSASTSAAASCDAPANTMVERPMADQAPSPSAGGLAPPPDRTGSHR